MFSHPSLGRAPEPDWSHVVREAQNLLKPLAISFVIRV